MSGMLVILLNGLSLFGAILIDPQELANDDAEEPIPAPEEPVQGGSNPIDIATQDPSEAETTPDPDPPVTGGSNDSDADTITGSEQSNAINAGAGDDTVDGGLGDDTISGGDGADSLEGGEGADVLFGGEISGVEDGEVDTLSGGAGADEIHLGDADIATGGAGADSFTRLSTMTSRALITDFDVTEDVIVIEHQSETPPSLMNQTVASDGVILELSDDSQIELAGLDAEIDASLISFVDTRAAAV